MQRVGLEGGSVAAQQPSGDHTPAGGGTDGRIQEHCRAAAATAVGAARGATGHYPGRPRTGGRSVGGGAARVARSWLPAPWSNDEQMSRLDERKPQTAAGATACWMLRGSPGLQESVSRRTETGKRPPAIMGDRSGLVGLAHPEAAGPATALRLSLVDGSSAQRGAQGWTLKAADRAGARLSLCCLVACVAIR